MWTGSWPDIQDSVRGSGRVRVRKLRAGRLRPLLIVRLRLAIFQQFVGVNTVIYHAPTILQQTGLTADKAVTPAVSVGLTNVVFTVLTILLLDKVRCRPLLIAGTIGLSVARCGLALYFGVGSLQHSAAWLAMVALLVYIACFAIALGPVFCPMISEIFPLRVRSKAMSITTVGNWPSNLLIAATFLSPVGAISRAGALRGTRRRGGGLLQRPRTGDPRP